jgi:predicted DNA-binding transcriptional regulator YafY
MRVFRVSRIIDLTLEGVSFERPLDFDLAAYWVEWCQNFEKGLMRWPVTVRVSPELAAKLPDRWGEWIRPLLEDGLQTSDGWRQITLHYDSLDWALNRLLPHGGQVEVIDPPELRQRIQDIAASILQFYNQPG